MNWIKVNKSTTVFVTLLFLLMSVVAFQFYQTKKEERRQFHAFLNQFYAQVDQALLRVNHIIDTLPENGTFNNSIVLFEQELLRTDTILKNGSALLNGIIPYTNLFNEMTYLLNGYRMSGSGSTTAVLLPIAMDGKLSSDEAHLLVDIRER